MLKFLIPLLLASIAFAVQDNLVNLQVEDGVRYPFVSVDSFAFGDDAYTIMWQCEFNSMSGVKTIVWAQGPNVRNEEDGNLMVVQVVGNNQMRFSFGPLNFQTVTLSGTLSANTLYSFTVIVTPTGTAGTINVAVFVNTEDAARFSGNIGGIIARGTRTATLGARNAFGTNAKSEFLNGMFDNFVIVAGVVDTSNRKSLHSPHNNWAPSNDILGRLALWIHFNDAILALQNTAVAITKVVNGQSDWVTATVQGNGFFMSHSPNTGGEDWRRCYVTGDPHYYNWGGAHVAGGEQLEGHRIYQTCDNEGLEIRTHTRYVQWWGNTVFRVASIKYKDYVFRINLDETGWAYTRAGTANVATQVPQGRFLRQVTESSWQALGDGTFVHGPTGARYTGWSSSSNLNFRITIPDVGSFEVNAYPPMYMNLYLTLNFARCTVRRGACDNQLYNSVPDVFFNDLRSPPPLPDSPTPPANPCTGVDAAIYARMQQACARYYPKTSSIAYQDCLFDACASGDPDIIPQQDLTPACQLERLTGVENPDCTVQTCQGNCFGRGDCVNGECVNCDAGFGGFDCFQPNSYTCHTASYGVVDLNVEPRSIFSTRADNLRWSFADYAVWQSVLIYPATYDGKEYLQFIVNSPESDQAGSFSLCMTVTSGATPAGAISTLAVPVSEMKVPGQVTVTQTSNWGSGAMCVDVSYTAYSVGGFFFEIDSQSTVFNIQVTKAVGLKQVLIGSQNSRGGLDVSKVPQVQVNAGFTWAKGLCQNSNCHVHDEDCMSCYATDGCGFCQETQRCMSGTQSGPRRGTCQNWRVSLDKDVSRVVTTKFNGDDLVDPDYEVYLSAVDNGVPVSIYVPTARTNTNIDIQFLFGTRGSFAANAVALKNNLLSSLFAFQTDMNLGIGFYGDIRPVVNLDLTGVNTLNQYLFARAMEVPSGTVGVGTGGVYSAIKAAISQTNYRRFSRRLAVFTVYEADTDANLPAVRAATLAANVFPVFLIPRGVGQDVVDYWTNLNNRLDGIPSLVIRIDQSGSDFASAFRQIFLLSASYPHVVVTDISDNQYNHVNRAVLSSEADALTIAGLTNTRLRARFTIPMLHHNTDNTHHVAMINIPGFGHSVIEDVADIDPIITGDRSFAGPESSTCIQVTVAAETFNNLAAPIFRITSLPAVGSLHLYDASQPNSVGAAVSIGYYAQKTFCFVPVQHDHSAPASAVYAQFTYTATDGCAVSNEATVSIFVTPIYYPPTTTVTPLVILETAQETPANIPTIDVVAFEADKDDNGVLETVTFTWSSFSVDYMSNLHGAAPVNFFSSVNQAPVGFLSGSYGPLATTNFQVTQTIRYNPPSSDFFGTFWAYVTLTDNTNKAGSSPAYPVTVQVIPVNDAPTSSVSADPNFDPSGSHQWVKEDTAGSIYIIGNDIDNFAIGVDLKLKSIEAGTVSAPPTVNGVALTTTSWTTNACVSSAESGRIVCEITYNPPANYNTCGNGIAVIPDASLLATCSATTPAFEIEYRVNDRNSNGFRWGDVNGNVADSITAVKSVAIHVIAVNDPPQAPPNTIVELVEDDPATGVVITVTDIDTVPSSIDMYVTTLCPSLITLTQQDGSPIAEGDDIADVVLKRYTQDHKFVATTIPNLHGTDRSTNWEICRITTTARDQQPLTSLTNGWVSIRVRPSNDAPYDLLDYFEKAEDVNEIYNVMDLTATDIDNDLSDLTYTITQLPWYDISLGEGVVIHIIDPSTGKVNEDVFLTEADLPYTVTLNADNEALVWVRSLANWYGRLDTAENALIYTVTDVDAFLNAGETGYKVNTVPSTVTIVIPPVNDRPITTVQPPAGDEDVVQVVYLLGENDKYGEGADQLDVTITAIQKVFSDSFTDADITNLFYKYDDDWYTNYINGQSVSVSDLIPIGLGDAIEDQFYRVFFIPPQNMNKAASITESPLFIAPQIQYEMRETFSHSDPVYLRSTISDWLGITVNPVNDVPVTWGGEWNVVSNAAYDAFYGGNDWYYPAGYGEDKLEYNNAICIDDCYFTEDFGLVGHYVEISPREIKFGGRDVEGDDLQVVIRSVDCQGTLTSPRNAQWEFVNDTGRFPIATTDLVGMTLGRLVKRLDGEGYKLVSMLAFAPARNDWNVPSAETHINDQSGEESDFYCQLAYAVVDSEGLASDDADMGVAPKTITIQVRQQNDQPTDSVLQDPRQSSTLVGFEDTNLFIKFDATDVEDDDFVFAVTACDSSRGKFYFPSTAQSSHINENGELDTTASIKALFGDEILCEDATINNPPAGMMFSATNGRGWYILFVPNENDYGQDFASITVSYDDNTVVGQAPQYSDRFIDIRALNDAPVIITSADTQNTLVVQQNQKVGLSLSFADVDAYTTSGQPINRLGFQFRVTSATLSNGKSEDYNKLFQYSVVPFDGIISTEKQATATDLGMIQWIGSIPQANSYAAGVSVNFLQSGDFSVEIVAVDGGYTGYCTPDVVHDQTVYPADDIRTVIGTNGQHLGPVGYEASRCNRVSTLNLNFKATASSAVVGGVATGAGAGLLALLALGAVVFAKLNKPEDLDAWQALDNAQFTNAQQSGIHKEAKIGGTSALYKGK